MECGGSPPLLTSQHIHPNDSRSLSTPSRKTQTHPIHAKMIPLIESPRR
jgi:hypothetical protein